MKTLKINAFRSLLILSFVTGILAACTNTDSSNQASTEVEKPAMDMHTAVISGDLEAVKQHIEAGTDINEKEPLSGATPLISAATFGQKEIAQTLINAGADLSASNNDGSTALHVAAFFCRVEVVQMLMDANADKNLRNSFGATARESVMGPFTEIKPIYEMMQSQLGPLGLKLNMNELEKTRPVIAMMLQ
jgi:hypothetical protein